MKDDQLIQSYIQGNQNSINILFDRYYGLVIMIALRMVNDRDIANDLTQETFCKALRYIDNDKYNQQGKFKGWISMICRSLCMDYFRISKRSVITTNEDVQKVAFNTIGESIDDQIITQEIKYKLFEILNLLPQEQRIIVEMRLYRDMSFKEISEELDIGINTALGRMRYGLINARKIIKQNNIDLNVA